MAKNKTASLKIINIFIVLVIIALGATAYLTLANASIIVPGDRELFKNSTVVTATANPVNNTREIYGTVVVKEYEITESFPAGTVSETASKAGGTVTIINTSQRNQPLVATTRLVTPANLLFRITSSVTVPAGGRVQVFAEADQAGAEYLIQPTRFTIPGLSSELQQLIYAETDSPMTFERRVEGAVTQTAVNAAKETLTQKIREMAMTEMQSGIADGLEISPDRIQIKEISLNANPAVGSTATNVSVTLKSSVTALIVNPDDLTNYIENALIESLPDPEIFVETLPESHICKTTSINEAEKTAELSCEAEAIIKSSTISDSIDRRQLTGKTLEQAHAYLLNQGIQGAEIRLFPTWMPTLPLLQDHIKIKSE